MEHMELDDYLRAADRKPDCPFIAFETETCL